MLPRVIVNFKTYETGIGHQAVEIAKKIDAASKNAQEPVAISVGAMELAVITATVGIDVYAQHVDGVDIGSHTGDILPKAIKLAGGKGSLINHSEDPYDMKDIKAAIEQCKKDGIVSIACAPDTETAKQIAALGPDAIAVEPPELIGKGVSVSQAQPEIVASTCRAVREVNPKIKVYCGAGVHTRDDAIKAVALGAHGVLLASGVMKVDDPGAIVENLCAGVKSLSSSDKSDI